MKEQSQEVEEKSIRLAKRESLISVKKKLEYLAHQFDPDDYPSKNPMITDLLSEFHLVSDNPFTITNKILVLLDETLETIEDEKRTYTQ